MNKIILETESYLTKNGENQRFFPFLELEYNEWVIYEDDEPKYFFQLSTDLKSESEIINRLTSDLENGKDLRDLIIALGRQVGKKWDIFSSHQGEEIEGSFQLEKIELEKLSDQLLEK